MIHIFKLLILSVTFYSISSTPVDPCSDGSPLPISVDVVGCENQPCPFRQNTDAELYLNFVAPEELHTIQARVVATVGIEIPFPLPQPDACIALTNTHCPLEINEPAQYKLLMPISPQYPAISLRLAFSLVGNGQSQPFTCFSIQAQVVAA